MMTGRLLRAARGGLRQTALIAVCLLKSGFASAQGSGATAEAPVNATSALHTAAAVSGRPALCEPAASPHASALGQTSWSNVRRAKVARRCARLAQASTLVAANPQLILERLSTALVLAASDPLSLAERRLVARALLHAGRAQEAYAAFATLQTTNPSDQWDAFSLHDYAVAARIAGQVVIADGAYRRLVSLSAWLPSTKRVLVLLEAAAAAVHTSPPSGTDALSYLSLIQHEELEPSGRATFYVIRAVARFLLEPERDLTPVPASLVALKRTQGPRLTLEDWRFIEWFCGLHEAANAGPLAASTDDDIPAPFTLPTYQRLVNHIHRAR